MFSTPHGPLVLESIKFQEKFLKEVSRTVLSLLVFRLDGQGGWEEKLRWQNSSISPKVYQGNMPYHDHLATSRVCVCFYNGTPFLETFAANYPTILCWDPRYTELNKLAQPYFKLLREVGILYDSPESAASKLNEIYQDPNSWWVSPKIQDARNKFCDRFARTSNDWLAQWKRELTKLATQ
jgi:putative transferase (TIGR04331 family)